MSDTFFYKGFAFIAILLALSIYFLQASGAYARFLLPEIWGFYIFFTGLTLIAYQVSLAGLRKDAEISVWFVLGTITVKLLASMILALFYLHFNEVNPVVFLTNFFILYFVYTTFEIYSLLSNLRAQKK